MIYTCTLNPSIDYELHVENFKLGSLNRAVYESYSPGGKGINVSILLNNINIESNVLGFIGGYSGQFIQDQLRQYNKLNVNFIEIKQSSRINIKLKSVVETEINASGPNISLHEYQKLLEKIKQIKKDDVFILSGSVPTSIENNVYQEIAKIVSEIGATLVVDSTKEKLLTTLKYNPILIKPNKEELEEIYDIKINNAQDIVTYAKMLQAKGAINVLVSMGKDGAILVTKDETYHAKAPIGNVKNTVGAGDSMVAGFIAEYIKSHSIEKALQFSIACGSATAFSPGIGTMDDINKIYKGIKIQKLKEK